MSNIPLITFENIACRYKYRKKGLRFAYHDALKDISFTLYKGETLGVLGRNGAGKSTLLRIVAGIVRPDAGRVINHQPVSISLLTLQLGFSVELSGRDNAILGALMLGKTKKEALDRLDAIHEFSDLGHWFYEPLKSYSSGMRARLGFAVAMEVSPDILLVDEVLGVGDEAFRVKSTAAMKERMRSGQTVLFVSHSLPSLRELCTRVIWIEDGVTRMQGETMEILRAYREHMIATQK